MMRALLAAFALFVGLSLAGHAQAAWSPVGPALNIETIAFDQSGSRIFAITPQGALYSWSPRMAGSGWAAELPNVKIKSVSVYPDGTVAALEAGAPNGYFKAPGGTWTKQPGSAEQILRTKSGVGFLRDAAGRVIPTDKGSPLPGAYRWMAAATAANFVYLTGTDGKLYLYQPGGSGTVAEHAGKASARLAAGTGSGTKGSVFVLSANPLDFKVYYFDVVGAANAWTALADGLGMKFLAMSPQGILHGVGLDGRLYRLDAPF